jgi:hypothetical protein
LTDRFIQIIIRCTIIFKKNKLPDGFLRGGQGGNSSQFRISGVLQLNLSGLIGTANYPDMNKFQINGIFFENRQVRIFAVTIHSTYLRLSRWSSVGIATRYGLDGPEIESRCGEIFRTCPDRPWGPLSLLYNGYRVFSEVKSGRVVTLTPHLLLVPLVMKE